MSLTTFEPRMIFTPALATGAAAPFALDGSSITANASTANLSVSGLSTSYANDVVVVAVITNGTGITSIGGTHGLTFAREPSLTPPVGGGTTIDLWYATTSSTVSAGATFIPNNSAAYTTVLVFALSGAKNSAPFDVNGAIPATTNSNAVPAATITTSATNTFAFGVAVTTADHSTGAYVCLNTTARSNNLELNYKFATTTLSADPFSNANEAVSLATAIVQGP